MAIVEISLTKGKVARIDEIDFELVSRFKWQTWGPKNETFYAISGRGGRMHRLILGAKKGEHVDHRDGDGLNNTRENLRICTNSQNLWNQKGKGARSGYKGVTRTRSNRWQSHLTLNGNGIYFGTFDTPEEAAMAYNDGAIKYFGEFAYLNTF